jgi:NADH-quinone oxidoreductase subunit J
MDFLIANFAEIAFYVFALLTVAGGVGVIALRNPVHAALSLLFTFIMVAVLFVLRHAEFLAAVQVLVYGGGIMVLFLFVIMLVNVKRLATGSAFLSGVAPLAVVAGVLLGVLVSVAIVFGVWAAGHGDGTELRTVAEGQSVPIELGNTEAVGSVLYTTYLVPFEVVSVVLLVAMIGAIVFGRRAAALETGEGRDET